MAALAIGSLGSRRAVPRLLELTQDADWFVRVAALNGLGYIDEALPAEPALVAIGDDEPLVRQAAALNMGGSSDPAAIDVLMEALRTTRIGPSARPPPMPLVRSGTRGRPNRSGALGPSGAWSSAGASSARPDGLFVGSRPPAWSEAGSS